MSDDLMPLFPRRYIRSLPYVFAFHNTRALTFVDLIHPFRFILNISAFFLISSRSVSTHSPYTGFLYYAIPIRFRSIANKLQRLFSSFRNLINPAPPNSCSEKPINMIRTRFSFPTVYCFLYNFTGISTA